MRLIDRRIRKCGKNFGALGASQQAFLAQRLQESPAPPRPLRRSEILRVFVEDFRQNALISAILVLIGLGIGLLAVSTEFRLLVAAGTAYFVAGFVIDAVVVPMAFSEAVRRGIVSTALVKSAQEVPPGTYEGTVEVQAAGNSFESPYLLTLGTPHPEPGERWSVLVAPDRALLLWLISTDDAQPPQDKPDIDMADRLSGWIDANARQPIRDDH